VSNESASQREGEASIAVLSHADELELETGREVVRKIREGRKVLRERRRILGVWRVGLVILLGMLAIAAVVGAAVVVYGMICNARVIAMGAGVLLAACAGTAGLWR
jgi:hypothetical protein